MPSWSVAVKSFSRQGLLSLERARGEKRRSAVASVVLDNCIVTVMRIISSEKVSCWVILRGEQSQVFLN